VTRADFSDSLPSIGKVAVMKIFFRYLFVRILQVFLITLACCTLLWVMVDLYGNMEEFLNHKVNLLLILRFYALQIPRMLVQALPAAVLISALFTLLSLNRRSELVALQAGGMAPLLMFSPFFLFAVLGMIVLSVDLYGPVATADVTRERLLKQVKGQGSGRNVFANLVYVDRVNSRAWYFQKLDANSGDAHYVEIGLRDMQGQDLKRYFAREAKWTGEFWRLTGVKEVDYGLDNSMQSQRSYEELDLPDITTPPGQLSLIASQPEQLTVSQLSRYIATSTATPDYLAQYRTEWWYRVLYPFSLIVLMLYGLLQGTRTDRGSAVFGVVMAIIVLIVYTLFMNVFLVAGKHNRLSPFLAVTATPMIFGSIGLYLLAANSGWWWQLRELWKEWQAARAADGKEEVG
jgi:LPS export ABC transporter permease LptG